jgi:hypothetical protein
MPELHTAPPTAREIEVTGTSIPLSGQDSIILIESTNILPHKTILFIAILYHKDALLLASNTLHLPQMA